jgi:hypothetical protein
MDDKKAKKTAGALDVRNIIGLLMAVYGVILVLMGLFSDSTAPKSADVNSNLWAGLALPTAAHPCSGGRRSGRAGHHRAARHHRTARRAALSPG